MIRKIILIIALATLLLVLVFLFFKVRLNINTSQNKNFTIPQDFVIEPKARRTFNAQDQIQVAQFESHKSQQELIDFYRQKLLQSGWTITSAKFGKTKDVYTFGALYHNDKPFITISVINNPNIPNTRIVVISL